MDGEEKSIYAFTLKSYRRAKVIEWSKTRKKKLKTCIGKGKVKAYFYLFFADDVIFYLEKEGIWRQITSNDKSSAT